MKVLSDAQTLRSSRTKLSRILGMRLHDCDPLPSSGSGVTPLSRGASARAMQYLPSSVVDLSNVTVNSDVVALLARRLAAVSPFSYDELFLSGAEIPADLLQVAFKQSELLSLSVTNHGRPLDRLRLILLYHGLLTCCGVTSRLGVSGGYIDFYMVRPSNLSSSLIARPLETELAKNPPGPLTLLHKPTVASMTEYFQRIASSSVRRLNEYAYQQGITKWFESWAVATGRTDITVEFEVCLKGTDGVRYLDFELRDADGGRALVIEIKHIPLSAVDYARCCGSRMSKAALRSYLQNKKSAINLSLEEVLSLPLAASYKPHKLPHGRAGSFLLVKDVLDGAVVQLLEMVALHPQVDVLHAFVVMQVHRRTIVHEVCI